MTPLSKIFYLLICLFVYLLILAPSPSLAAPDYTCHTDNDCQQFASSGMTYCVCNPPAQVVNGKCTPNGTCVQPIACQTDPDCQKYGGDDVCDPKTKECINIQQAQAGQSNTYAPWFIETPEKYGQAIEDAIQNNTGEIDSRIAFTDFMTRTMSFFSYTAGSTTKIADFGGGTKNTAGVTGTIAGLIVDMTTQPTISSKDYLADLGKNLGITPVSPAYAQGIGFNAFLPALDLWKVFRNIAYLAFIAIFLIVGLLVMFRYKIDPRTVVTIQEALPKIIVSLILITFSYAIAGFIVDVSIFATRLIGKTFQANDLIAFKDAALTKDQLLEKLFNDHIFTLVNPLRSESKLINYLSYNPDTPILGGPLTYVSLKFIFVIINFYIMFKIFFSLIGPYVSIILSVIFAPIYLLLGALPGPNNSVTNWLKGLISNVAVFPVVFTLLAIAAVFKGNDLNVLANCDNPQTGILFRETAIWCTNPSKAPSSFLSIPAIGNWGPVVGDLIAFGILFAIPNITKMIQEAFGQKPSALTSAFPQEFAAGAQRIPLVGGLMKNVYGGGQ